MTRTIRPFDEYSLFARSTQFLTQRRHASNQTFLTVNTIIFAALGLILKDAVLAGWRILLVSLPLVLVGIAACAVWRQALSRYERLIGWRYEQLMALELGEGMAGSHRFYAREWEAFYSPDARERRVGFSSLESLLPILIGLLYVLFAICLFVLVLAGLPGGMLAS